MQRSSPSWWCRWLFLGASAMLGCSSGEGGADNTGEGAATLRPCGDPQALLDVATGFVKCEGGWMHRAVIGRCPVRAGASAEGGAQAGADAGLGVGASCTTDADCADLPYGYCVQTSGCAADLGQGPHCDRGCATDADCASGSICECGDTVGHCVAATCKTDADCSGGALCAGLGYYQCQSPADECYVDEQCSHASCGYTEGRRVCIGGIC